MHLLNLIHFFFVKPRLRIQDWEKIMLISNWCKMQNISTRWWPGLQYSDVLQPFRIQILSNLPIFVNDQKRTSPAPNPETFVKGKKYSLTQAATPTFLLRRLFPTGKVRGAHSWGGGRLTDLRTWSSSRLWQSQYLSVRKHCSRQNHHHHRHDMCPLFTHIQQPLSSLFRLSRR